MIVTGSRLTKVELSVSGKAQWLIRLLGPGRRLSLNPPNPYWCHAVAILLPNVLAPTYFASVVIIETASVGGIETLVSTLFHRLSHPHPFDWFMGHRSASYSPCRTGP